MRLSQLAAIPLVFLLAGCPNLLGSSGNEDLNVKVLAVSETIEDSTTAKTYLTWQHVTNVQHYDVIKTLGSTTKRVLENSNQTSYTEPIGIGATPTYKVIAKDASGNEKTTESVTVKVLGETVSAPKNLKVAGESPVKDVTFLIDHAAAKPDLAWDKVENATHYFVQLKDGDGKVYYAAFTDKTQATVGSLLWDDLKLPHFKQVKDQSLPSNRTVFFTVSAVQANDSDLKAATALNYRASAEHKIIRE